MAHLQVRLTLDMAAALLIVALRATLGIQLPHHWVLFLKLNACAQQLSSSASAASPSATVYTPQEGAASQYRQLVWALALGIMIYFV